MLVADAGFPGLVDRPRLVIRDRGDRPDHGNGACRRSRGLQALARETAASRSDRLRMGGGDPGFDRGSRPDERRGARIADGRRAQVGARSSTSNPELRPPGTWRSSTPVTGASPSGLADVVVLAELALASCEPEAALAKVREVVRWRVANQPGGFNAGSVFTNPPGDSAGRLIDAAGLKGMRHGSASVSEKHANFFQADKRGSADDVRALIDEVRAAVSRTRRGRPRPRAVHGGLPRRRRLPTVQKSSRTSTSTRGSGRRDLRPGLDVEQGSESLGRTGRARPATSRSDTSDEQTASARGRSADLEAPGGGDAGAGA